jgi:hypothetical protein
MRINYYYKQVFERKNPAKDFLLTFLMWIAAGPRMLCQVYIRKNFGERYFTLLGTSIVILFFALMPFIFGGVSNLFTHLFRGSSSYGYGDYSDYDPSFWGVIKKNALWYLYLVGAVVMSIKRSKEITSSRSSFDFNKFSYYSGDILPQIWQLKIFGKPVNPRQIEKFIEPGIFLALGILLALMKLSIGTLFIICSFFYWLGNTIAYYIGDFAMLDIIDKMIANISFKEAMTNKKQFDEKTKFRVYSRPIEDPEEGEKIYNNSFVDDRFDDVI